MEAILTAIKVQLDAQSEILKELLAENAALRKEIFGTGASGHSSEDCDGLMESKTLREVVDEIRFEVKALTSKFSSSNADNKDKNTEEFPVVEIRTKTLEEERDWIEERLNEPSQQKFVVPGASLEGTTIENISWAIPFPKSVRATCVIKISNYLNSSLTDPQYRFWWNGTLREGPSCVASYKSEASCFEGENTCELLCSFRINGSLRLTLYFDNNPELGIRLGIGFTPEGVPTDTPLWREMNRLRFMPDIMMMTGEYSRVPLDVFVSHGNFFAKAHMTPGPRSVAHVEIMEANTERAMQCSTISVVMKPLIDGMHTSSNLPSDGLQIHSYISTLAKVACTVEIANCLNVKLQNSNFYCKSALNNFMSLEIISFRKETFFAVDDASVEAMFSYDIESTDLRFLLALRAQPNNNSFAAAFAPLPVEADVSTNGFADFMDSKEWKTHLYKKSARAIEGEQLIQTRNIRASINMTDEDKSLVKILIFAV